MPNMDYLRRQNISQRNRQFLTSYDWELWIDFSNYKFYHPTMNTLILQTKAIQNVNPTLTHSLLETDIRGFHYIQPGMTDNKANANFTLELADFDDQSLKYWFLDWQNKMDSSTTHASYRREDLMVNCYVWRLNGNRQKVWQMEYINCLPDTTSYSDVYDGNKAIVGDGATISIKGEMAIPTPLTQPLS